MKIVSKIMIISFGFKISSDGNSKVEFKRKKGLSDGNLVVINAQTLPRFSFVEKYSFLCVNVRFCSKQNYL